MTDQRAELLRLIAGISEMSPDLRLGQMMANLATLARGAVEGAVWDCEDAEFIPAARRMLEHYRNLEPEPAAAVAD